MESAEPVMETPPRPIITKMVLENFKSYAGVKEIGPFHKVAASHLESAVNLIVRCVFSPFLLWWARTVVASPM